MNPTAQQELTEFKCLDCPEWSTVYVEHHEISVWVFRKAGGICWNCGGTNFDYHSTRRKL